MRYRIEIKRSALKELSKLPAQIRRELTSAIDALAAEPRPANSKKLSGVELYSRRVGNYRVLYEIIDERLLVIVVRAGHRKDVYRHI
ncbi:MAG: type II toxin-antitoxin system RelE/ParE family toxin [Caldilineaceae bacterium]